MKSDQIQLNTKKENSSLLNNSIKKATPESLGLYEGPITSKCQYHIYHSISKGLRFTETKNQPRKYVGLVIADSLNEAYNMSQNNYPGSTLDSYGERSTSVGDVIQDGYGFYMVTEVGFELLCTIEDSTD